MVRAVTFILAFLCILCSCDDSVKDLQRYQLHGNVRHVEMRYDDGGITDAFFGRTGMLDSLMITNLHDTLRHIYVYDRRGRLDEIKVLHTDGTYEALYEYEYRGRVLSSYSVRGCDMQVLFRWDFEIRDGKTTGYRCYNEEGALAGSCTYSYDGEDKTEIHCSPDGEVLYETTYRYAGAGRISCIESDDLRIGIEYDEAGLPMLSRGAFIGPDGEIYSNEDSRKYDIVRYEYVMDEAGNWTERTEFLGESGIRGKTIKRKINYR